MKIRQAQEMVRIVKKTMKDHLKQDFNNWVEKGGILECCADSMNLKVAFTLKTWKKTFHSQKTMSGSQNHTNDRVQLFLRIVQWHYNRHNTWCREFEGWFKTIVITLFFITSYNSFAPSFQFAIMCFPASFPA